jgi:hypothetical protein
MIGTLRPLIDPSTPRKAIAAEIKRKIALQDKGMRLMSRLIEETRTEKKRKLHAKLVDVNLDLGIPTFPLDYFLNYKPAQAYTEVLRWVNITPETMPDALELVLIEREDDGVNEPTWPGYWDGEQWMDVDGELFPGKPLAWCTWPGGRKGVRL